MSSNKIEEIVIDTKKQKGKISKLLEEEQAENTKEYENTKLQRMIAEERARKREVEQSGQSSPPRIIGEVTQSVEGKTILEAVRTGVEVAKVQPTPPTNVEAIIKSMADMFKTGVEIGQNASKPQPQEGRAEKYLDLLVEELRAARQENQRDRETRLEKEIAEIKMRPSAMDEIARDAEKFGAYKKAFGAADSGIPNEYILKKLEMEQLDKLENKKIEFAREERLEKRENEREGTKELYGLIGKVVGADGVVGKLASGLGSLAKNKLEARGRNPTSEPIIQITCPQCSKPFDVLTGTPMVLCPNCRATLQLQPQPQQNLPMPTPPKETQSSGQASGVEQPAESSGTNEQPTS